MKVIIAREGFLRGLADSKIAIAKRGDAVTTMPRPALRDA